jgi:hypothetical protein
MAVEMGRPEDIRILAGAFLCDPKTGDIVFLL